MANSTNEHTPKSKLTPIGIAMGSLFLVIVLILSVWQPRTEQTAKESSSIPYTELIQQNNKPSDMHNDYAIYVAKTEEQYVEYSRLFNVTTQTVNFSKQDVVFAQFISDGCGLVVDGLHVTNKTLNITLNLPVDLRNELNLACTSIGKTNTVVLKTEKLDVINGVFNGVTKATFNEYEIYVETPALIRGYIVQLTDTNMLVTENNTAVDLARITNPKINTEAAISFTRHANAELGDYVVIYGENNDGIGTIESIQIEKQISVHGANSVVQTYVKQTLQELAIQQMEVPFIAATYFDAVEKTWEIKVIDGHHIFDSHVFTYKE